MKLSLETCASFGGSYVRFSENAESSANDDLAQSGEREVVRASATRRPSVVPAAPGASTTLFDGREVQEMRPYQAPVEAMVEAVEEVAFVADEDVPEARVTQPVPVEPETLPVLPARAPRANGRAHGRRPARAERAATVTATRAKKKVEQADRARAERQALTADELLARYPFEGFGGAGFVKAM